jgi:predicted CoA-binding protein
MSVESFLAADAIAIVGVSSNPDKYGTRVWHDLRKKGYTVYGVNPRLETLDGEKIYPDIASLPSSVQALNLVVPPKITEQIVEQAIQRGIRHIWMQPGAESEAAIEACRANSINVIHSQCVMVQALPARRPPGS